MTTVATAGARGIPICVNVSRSLALRASAVHQGCKPHGCYSGLSVSYALPRPLAIEAPRDAPQTIDMYEPTTVTMAPTTDTTVAVLQSTTPSDMRVVLDWDALAVGTTVAATSTYEPAVTPAITAPSSPMHSDKPVETIVVQDEPIIPAITSAATITPNVTISTITTTVLQSPAHVDKPRAMGAVSVPEQLISVATSSISVRQQTAEIIKGSNTWSSVVKTIRKRCMEQELYVQLRKDKTKRQQPNRKRSPSPEHTTSYSMRQALETTTLQYTLGPTTQRIALPKQEESIVMYLELKPRLRVHSMAPMSPTLMVLLSLAKYDVNGFLTHVNPLKQCQPPCRTMKF
jgi:hypothetical protein